MRMPSIRMPMLSDAQRKKAMAGSLLVVLVLIVTVLGPATGFVTFGNSYEEEISTLTTDLAGAELSLSETSDSLVTCQDGIASASAALAESQTTAEQCNSDLALSQEELSSAQNQLSSAQNELQVSVSYATQLENDKSVLEGDKTQLENKNAQLEASYNALVDSAAIDLCCIQKVFDSSLSHYYVEDNQIICTSEETIICTSEETGAEFACQ